MVAFFLERARQQVGHALFILDYQHDHQLCQLKEAIYAARCVRFGTPRRPGFSVGYAFAALQEWLRDHVVETVSWIGGDGSKLYRVRGADGRWRDVPNGELITRPN